MHLGLAVVHFLVAHGFARQTPPVAHSWPALHGFFALHATPALSNGDGGGGESGRGDGGCGDGGCGDGGGGGEGGGGGGGDGAALQGVKQPYSSLMLT